MVTLILAMLAQVEPHLPVVTDGLPMGSTSTILITTIAGFLSLLVTQFVQMWRESQRRKWDLQDRSDARKEAERRSELQRRDTIQTARVLAELTKESREHLIAEISKNTELTKQVGGKADAAYVAANNFNEKLAEVIATGKATT